MRNLRWWTSMLVAGGVAWACAKSGESGLAPPGSTPGGAGGTDAGGGSGGGAPDAWVVDTGTDDASPPLECQPSELCNDGFDNDCNGTVDDDCQCLPGDVAECYRGPVATFGLGDCAAGTMLCTGAGEFGLWGPCTGDVLPATEVCDDGGHDENCDGSPNDGCECVEGTPDRECGSTVGRCRAGSQTCVGGEWAECEEAVFPVPEECNGVDDDCDGSTDEGLTRACGSSVGSCRPGTQACTAGDWGACTGGSAGGTEVCNGADDDCDGTTDEGTAVACGTDVGACSEGTRACVGGELGECTGALGPREETCNGEDDDCDGSVDEELTRPCGKDDGECQSGTETCSQGVWGACAGSVGPKSEACDGARDDDCDGVVDNGCTCTIGARLACGSDTGECTAGEQSCGASGAWGACLNSVGPKPEQCDGLDNDCNGTKDDGCACVNGQTRPCGTDEGECVRGTETCSLTGVWGLCSGGKGPATELCNSKDDDCDRLVDEDDVCPKYPPSITCPGAKTGLVGAALSLVGGGSDPDGGTVTFTWSVTSRPTGSSATPSPATAATTAFTPDAAGAYVLRLVVTDDERETAQCIVNVTATSPCTPPAAPVIAVCGTSWDRRPVVEFATTPIPSGVSYEVWQQGDATPLATVSDVGRNYFRPAAAIGTGSAPPGTTSTLYVKACTTGNSSCCATSNTQSTRLVAACTTAVPASAQNVVFSEYIINGTNGSGCPGPECEAGEAIEITNLSHCPVSLAGTHFGYESPGTTKTTRWMNFGSAELIPPRGVYVAIRNQAATTCELPFFGPSDPGIFGLRISTLAMEGSGLTNGWFNNSSGGQLRIATGTWVNISTGTAISHVATYLTTAPECGSIGFDAVDKCGEVLPQTVPTTRLNDNQLGRLWHPCDAVASPMPAACR